MQGEGLVTAEAAGHGVEAVEALQRRLAGAADEAPLWQRAEGERVRVGGVFAAPFHGLAGLGTAADPAWAAAVVVEDGEVVDEAVVAGTFSAPYQAGYLALRQLPLLEGAVRALRATPDVLLVNATGRDHPRRAGLALHLGAVLGVPTIGVTDRPLVAEAAAPGPRRGDRSELRLNGELVGFSVRTRAAVRPVYISAGWRTDPETATSVVLAVCEDERTPVPLREARHRAREARTRGR
ncbi:MAG TPA: endonuclease V [Candidatus Dormibacteraeota bacterium]